MSEHSETTGSFTIKQRAGLFGGPLLCLILLFLPHPEGLEPAALAVAAVGLLMAVWWLTEAVPIPATAMLPLVLFPPLGVAGFQKTAAPFANPLIYLFLGGFIIALAMQRWNLHRRIALNLIRKTGTSPHRLVLGFMIATAFLSMWISNTATAMMMLPIALSVAHMLYSDGETLQENNFVVILMLAIAYSASIGGLGTLIGTPPNAFLAAFVKESYDYDLNFGTWMLVGVPLVVISLPLVYYVLTRVVYKVNLEPIAGADGMIDREIEHLGKWSRGETLVGIVFISVAVLWILRSLIEPLTGLEISGISDAGIAMAGALLLFVLPVNLSENKFVMNWQDTRDLPWGLLVLFGGGLSLAAAIDDTGLGNWMGNQLADMAGDSPIILLVVSVIAIVFLTELTSNTATTATFLPLLAPVAISMGQNPLFLLVPAALAASCAFMLPVATPPNAIVFGSGHVPLTDMARAGAWLNILFIFLIIGLMFTLASWVLGIHVGVLPGWLQTAS